MAGRLVDKMIGGIRLQGISLAGEETVIIVPEFGVGFDIGRAPREAVFMDCICLSHGHMDHSAGLAYYFSQRNFQGVAPGCVLVHHRLVPAIHDLLSVWGRIEGHVSPGRIVGVDEDEDFEIRKGLLARPFRVRHRGPTLGFSIIEVRKKLRPEYAGYSGQQIVELKKTGQSIDYRLEIPKVAYCADTEVGDFLDRDYVRNAEVLIIECTFFEEEHLVRAREGQHTHVQDLPGLLERVNSPHIVLSHITRRTFMSEVKRTLTSLLKPADLQRLTILMDVPRHRRPAAT